MRRHRLVPTARSVASSVLVRVTRDGAFAAAALDTELDRNVQLEPRDRALTTELVYGTLRLHGWLEQRLAKHAPRGLSKLSHEVRAVLVLAAYQILALERVPAFAAVNEAVSAVRALSDSRVAGFVNAILRKLANEPRPADGELARAALASIEPALAHAIFESIGQQAALDWFAGSEPPPQGIRVEDPLARPSWVARLRDARPNAKFEAGRVCPHAVLVRFAGRLTDLPGYREGAWTPQEEGAQVVALALGAREGDVVLDACAGRGNKSGFLARAVGKHGAVDAADLHPKKLDGLERDLERIGVRVRHTFPVDWSKGKGDVTGPYDRILVDAPCSGVGTVRRRPEILLRRTASDLENFRDLARSILARASTLVRPGGRVVYAVCSILREEAEAVVASANECGLKPIAFDAPIALSVAPANATSFRLLPHVHGTDGYFVASFVR
jgi:16S rRNA (cytosine967-C5)-methyltransferase